MTDIEKRIDRWLRRLFFPTVFCLKRADIVEDDSGGLYFAYVIVGLTSFFALLGFYVMVLLTIILTVLP